MKKLVTYYDDENIRHVFAIGYTYHKDYEERYGCIIDLLSDVGYSTYNAGYVKKSLENTFTDVTAIGKYVVTVGYSNLFGVDVRVFDKNHPFQPSGIQNSIYQVSGIPSFGYYQWNEVDALITSVPDPFPCNKNNISIASIFRTVFGDMSTNWTINLVELDVNSIVSHNPTAIVNSRNLSSLHYYSPLKLRELRYNPYNRRFKFRQ